MPTINYQALEELEINLSNLLKKSAKVSLFITVGFLVFLIIVTGTTTIEKIQENAGKFFVPCLFLFVIPFFLLQSILGNKIRSAAFKKFAENNNFTFSDTPGAELQHAHFFSYGNSQKFSFCISSTQTQSPFSFFNFQYGVTHRDAKGRASTTWYPFTVFALQLQKAVPNIYIHNKNNQTIDEPFTEEQRLSINVNLDYEKGHAVYAPKQYEIEALQILDSPFIEKLSQIVSGYDVEFYDSKMFIYIPSVEGGSSETLEGTKKLFALYDSLNQTLLQKMNTFSFAQIGDASTLLKKDGLSFLQSNSNVFGFIFSRNGLSIIIVIVILLISAINKFIVPLITN